MKKNIKARSYFLCGVASFGGKYSVPLICLLLFVASCKSAKEDVAPTTEKALIDFVQVCSVPAAQSKLAVTLSGIKLPAAEIKYDITAYKGKKIKASGLVTLPSTSNAVGMLSFQHGTTTLFEEAPSALATSTLLFHLYTLPSSFGFISVAPDYIGFGASKQYRHPYYVDEAPSAAVLDLLKAAKELAASKSINFNSKLFLAGYSQGGCATLSAHRAIEKKPLDGINLIASFPAAGGYDLAGMQKIVFGFETYSEPVFLGYVLTSYKNYYQMNDLYAAVLKLPYAEKIDGLYDGTHSTAHVNAALTTTVADLLTPDAHAKFDVDPKFSSFLDALKNNSVINWKPEKPVYFYHGDADLTVPYQTTTDTRNSLIAAGASPDLVKIIVLEGKDHGTGVVPYAEEMLKEVLKLR